MQKSKTGKFSIFNSLDVKLKFLTSWIKLTQFSVESSRVELKIWAIRLKSSWKCEQFDSISIRVQNVNSKLDLTISLWRIQICSYYDWWLQSIYDHLSTETKIWPKRCTSKIPEIHEDSEHFDLSTAFR